MKYKIIWKQENNFELNASILTLELEKSKRKYMESAVYQVLYEDQFQRINHL